MSSSTATEPDLVLDEASRALLAAILADPHAPLAVTIQAPGGYGKSSLLAQVRRHYQRLGVPVREGWSGGPGPADPDHVLLIDDAHLLDGVDLTGLRDGVRSRRTRLVLAHRPWPRPPAMVELTEMVNRDRPPLLLVPFTLERTAALLTRIAGAEPEPATIAGVQRMTGGVPRFVERLARALYPTDRSGPSIAPVEPTLAELPESTLAGFAPDLDGLDGAVRRLLLAFATGVDLPVELLARLFTHGWPDGTGEPATPGPLSMDQLLAAARSTGLLGRDDRLPPLARRAVATLGPAAERTAVWQRLTELQLHRGGPVLPLVRQLLDSGGGARVPAPLLTAAADEALPDEPALAAELLAAAADAGAPDAARHATAAALAGDLDSALRLADRLVATADSPDRAAVAAVAATALAHRGQNARAAELYRWSGTPSALAFGAIGAFGGGSRAELDTLLREPPVDGPPTLLSGATLATARGIRETLTAAPTVALSTLVQASALLEPAGRTVPLPDSPAALAALVAIQCGEFDIADRVLDRAVASRTGAALMARRHGLLQAWVLLLRGRSGPAAEHLAATTSAGSGAGERGLESRDLLFATALELGIARRNSDLPALRRGWEYAREALIRHPIDLFTLLPLGEIVVAAARLGELGQTTAYLDEADAILARLGGPALWATPLRWHRLHAAILAEQPAVADEHVAALADSAGHSRYATVLATAAESWVEVLGGAVDPVRVEAAARGLHGSGLCWDGARLAGQAAIRTSDRRAMTTLLDCARLLQGRAGGSRGTGQPASQVAEAVSGRDPDRLSDREQEVADLVLAGLTYRQVADRLFISAKTVEHHVARIRQRLQCGSRGELLSRLRAMAQERASGEQVGPPWPRRAAR